MHALALIALVVWIAAFLNTVLNLRLIRRIPAVALAEGPLVSVIIPARNEARSVEETLRAFLAQRYGKLEVIAVNDRGSRACLERSAHRRSARSCA